MYSINVVDILHECIIFQLYAMFIFLVARC
jgi:hypothetical protein